MSLYAQKRAPIANKHLTDYLLVAVTVFGVLPRVCYFRIKADEDMVRKGPRFDAIDPLSNPSSDRDGELPDEYP